MEECSKTNTSLLDVIRRMDNKNVSVHLHYQYDINWMERLYRQMIKYNHKVSPKTTVRTDVVYNGVLWCSKLCLTVPVEKTFLDTGLRKKEAVHKVTMAAALWLEHVYMYSHVPVTSIYKNNDNNSKINRLDKFITINRYHSSPIRVDKQFLQHFLQQTVTTNELNLLQHRNYSTLPNKEELMIKPSPTLSKIEDPIRVAGTASQQAAEQKEHQNANSVEKVQDLFPAPKNVLHNIYDLLAKEMNSRELNISPTYKAIKHGKQNYWTCSYKLKWPEERTFSIEAVTKQEASRRAALLVLAYLRTNEKITKQGQPIIYDKEVMKKLTRSTIPTIKLGDAVVSKMKEISALYVKEILPKLIKEVPLPELNSVSNVLEPGDIAFIKKTQKFLGYDRYLSKEKVNLPISSYKEQFMDLIKNNNIIILKGEPGCGKSTRIPQYVLESWTKNDGLLGEPCRIAVTQPRRIAAISLAERVASERDERVGNIVGYQVRLKSNFQPHTGRILYCTTGILLRQYQKDPLLRNYTHIILDEAHERDVNTDLLMSMLGKTVCDNPALKLIVMSATIDTDMFQRYYPGAAVMNVPGFTYPVKSYYLDTCKSLNLQESLKMCSASDPTVVHEDVATVLKYIHQKKPEGGILCFLPGWEDISKIRRLLPNNRSDMMVLCLHSKLQDDEQWKIFSRPPPGVRKIILATNIAETSVTIDDIGYVVDTGIHKEKRFDLEKGVMCLDSHWISQSSIKQRKGRAGRVREGECFHLYTRSLMEKLEKFSMPEILRTSLTKIVLDSKVYNSEVNAAEFFRQLPSPPEEGAVQMALGELKDLDLIDRNETLTALGRTLVDFPLEPKLAKAMVNAVVYKCVTPVVDVVTLFSSETDMFVGGLESKQDVQKTKSKFHANSDHLSLMRLYERWLAYYECDPHKLETFCMEMKLVSHKAAFINKLVNIHSDYLKNGLSKALPISDMYSDNDELVKAVLWSALGTVLQHRSWDIVRGQYKKKNTFLTRNNHRATIASESVNYKKTKFSSNFLLYINETRSNARHSTVIRECSVISPMAVLLFSNKKLVLENITKDQFSSELDSIDQVILNLADTKLKFLCDRQQALEIMNCKMCLTCTYQYFINQLTTDSEFDEKLNKSWDDTLVLLNDLFTV